MNGSQRRAAKTVAETGSRTRLEPPWAWHLLIGADLPSSLVVVAVAVAGVVLESARTVAEERNPEP